ncbi:MAG TPA: hypothetical protein VFG84_01450 [Gemmatimonadaceae bacterium]|nr:hypothetical protein [Gemmatimonadaceae bacterium]
MLLPRIDVRHATAWVIPMLLTAVAACDVGDQQATERSVIPAAQAAAAAVDSSGAQVELVRTIRTHARKEMKEASSAAASVAQPGVVFTINDSGHDPWLFALDSTGADRGVWSVNGATNRDWEALALGACANADDTSGMEAGVPRCIYIGDVGDNDAKHASLTLYRVREPAVLPPGRTGTLDAERVTFRYSDGRHDVEAMYVAADGAVFFITKRPLKDAAGRARPALIFRLPLAAWSGGAVAIAELVDSLPIVPGSAPRRMITDAALAPDRRRLVVRTYRQLFTFAIDAETGLPRADVPPGVCNVRALDEKQGEGVTWWNSGRSLLLVSEGRKEPMLEVRCPMARAD